MGAELKYRQIVVPYTPKPWQRPLHMDLARFNVVNAHRGWGKSYVVCAEAVDECLSGPRKRVLFVAPQLKTAKATVWEYLKYLVAGIPGVSPRPADNVIEFPNGSRIDLVGADDESSQNALRGRGVHLMVIDEVAAIRGFWNLWTQILRPMLNRMDIKGRMIAISTPHGMDAFHDLAQLAQSDITGEWRYFDFSGETSGAYSKTELEALRNDMGDTAFMQEIQVSFDVSDVDVIIPLAMHHKTKDKTLTESMISAYPRIMGIDIGYAENGDPSVIVKRQGNYMHPPTLHENLTVLELAAIVANQILQWKPAAVFIDQGGGGQQLADHLRALGYPGIHVIPFGSSPYDPRFANKRCEMYWGLREWVSNGGVLPDSKELLQELTQTRWSTDALDRKIKLEPKVDLKKRIGRSPDRADAAALTFAMPIPMNAVYGGYRRDPYALPEVVELTIPEDWDPYDDDD